jgi:hypothetical protein
MLDSDDPQVATAVEFLSEVFEKGLKGHKEDELRKYLLHRRHLNTAQVDLAFKIYNLRIENRKVKGEAERQEVSSQKNASVEYNFLLPINRARGINLIRRFLKTEHAYCDVLECLIEEYYKYLGEKADRREISISRKELELIFQRILKLFDFHKKFYMDLKPRKDKFGQLFVRHFNSFRDYVDYMKECNKTIKKMREYIYDKKLRKSLDHVRSTCRRPNDDMMDLILSPMYRIKDYKDFIDNLYGWADKNHDPDYLFLGKASRRIGRVVKWIEMYKHSIINQNEMNKVQQFLDTQCSIIVPNRRIVRRGMMIRRTTTWPARNKCYLFFLFNDVLLWTTRKGELQNVVFLQDCEVRPSESKYNQARKFEVVATGQQYKYYKLLKLECKDPLQRNEWYDAIKNEVASTKEVKPKAEKKKDLGEEDLVKWLQKNAEAPTSPENMISPEHKRDEEVETAVDSEDEEAIERPAHRRLQSSRNFIQDFKGSGSFLPLDEMTGSGISDTEQEPVIDPQDKYGGSMEVLFPNADGMTPSGTRTSRVHRTQGQRKINSGSLPYKNRDTLSDRSDISRSNVGISVYRQNGSIGKPESRKMNQSRENSHSSTDPSKMITFVNRHSASYLETLSSFTVRLHNFDTKI